MNRDILQTWLPVIALLGAAVLLLHLQYEENRSAWLGVYLTEGSPRPAMSMSLELSSGTPGLLPAMPAARPKVLEASHAEPGVTAPALLLETPRSAPPPQEPPPEGWDWVEGLKKARWQQMTSVIHILIPRQSLSDPGFSLASVLVYPLQTPEAIFVQVGLGRGGWVTPGNAYREEMQTKVEWQDREDAIHISLNLENTKEQIGVRYQSASTPKEQ